MDILILGCGVSGLTTEIRPLEACHTVAIWTRDLSARTTSSVAAAEAINSLLIEITFIATFTQRYFAR